MVSDEVIVAVDVGNTAVSAGIFVGGSLVRTTRVPAPRLRQTWRLFGRAAEDFRGKVAAAVVGSVVPEFEEAASEIASGEFDTASLVYRKHVPVGLELDVKEPERVGTDRLAGALAAFKRTKGAVVVVDFGTAVTVDAVSGSGAFLGGAIFPGAGVGAEALAQRTALLPEVELTPECAFPGKDTETAVRAGLLLGTAGAADRLVEEAWEILGNKSPVLATGGEARLLVQHARNISEVEPALTLEGLMLALKAHLEAK